MSAACEVLVIGGGPAGLRAAEIVRGAGFRTIIADQMPSMGRKFLVAGKGGLNLTHAEPLEKFLPRYGQQLGRWRELLHDFSPEDTRKWAQSLGTETFIGTSNRVFPLEKKAAPLLRCWIERLRRQGVEFRVRHRLLSLEHNSDVTWTADFDVQGKAERLHARAIILALGGASWPQTGSDGKWTVLAQRMKIPFSPLTPANCGYEVDWTASFLERCEGCPLKNIRVTADGVAINGELLITRYGLEGGALYQLGPVLRKMKQPRLVIDLKPAFTSEQVMAKLKSIPERSWETTARACQLSTASAALLGTSSLPNSVRMTAELIKALPIDLIGPRPIEEAISSAGGVNWENLEESLMLKQHSGLFCAGEMINWEAPTGGYLLQGCLAMGTRAGSGTIHFLQSNQTG